MLFGRFLGKCASRLFEFLSRNWSRKSLVPVCRVAWLEQEGDGLRPHVWDDYANTSRGEPH